MTAAGREAPAVPLDLGEGRFCLGPCRHHRITAAAAAIGTYPLHK